MDKRDLFSALEERFRGPPEEIKFRLSVYLDFIKPFQKLFNDVSLIDIGCGRGDWLELLTKEGFNPTGIDLNQNAVNFCKEKKLEAIKADGINFLKNLPDESQTVISAFHFIEHIQFEDLKVFISESFRALKPGGLLILETPNVENLTVSSVNFYIDPSHIRPIPSQLLNFLLDYYNFKRVKLLKLQEPRALIGKDNIQLLDVLTGVSPDYGVVAQKNASLKILDSFDTVFSKNISGLELSNLSSRFDQNLTKRASEAESRAKASETQLVDLAKRASEAESRAKASETQLVDLAKRASEAESRAKASETQLVDLAKRASEAESRAKNFEDRVYEIENSLIFLHQTIWWRLSYSLMKFKLKLKESSFFKFNYLLNQGIQIFILWVIKKIKKNLKLKNFILYFFLKNPFLAKKINSCLGKINSSFRVRLYENNYENLASLSLIKEIEILRNKKDNNLTNVKII
jgi:O-antigen chain-terminating methyltransferase